MINAYAQDPESIKQRTNYAESIMRDMVVKDQLMQLKESLGIDAFKLAIQRSCLKQKKSFLCTCN